MKKLLASAVLLTMMGAFPALPQDKPLLGSARTAVLQSDVVFNKNRKFNSNAIPFLYIYQSGLLRHFREVRSNPDIIIKFHKDVFLIGEEKISLTVFNADDNSVIYSEERTLVEEQNDVNRLVAHFLAKVKVERDLVTKAVCRRNGSRKKRVGSEKAG